MEKKDDANHLMPTQKPDPLIACVSTRTSEEQFSKEFDDLSHKDTATTSPKELSCIFPFSKTLYIIVLLPLFKMTR